VLKDKKNQCNMSDTGIARNGILVCESVCRCTLQNYARVSAT